MIICLAISNNIIEIVAQKFDTFLFLASCCIKYLFEAIERFSESNTNKDDKAKCNIFACNQ